MKPTTIQSRREFIRSLSFYTGSSLFFSSLPWISRAIGNTESISSDKIKIGIIGTGSRGRCLLQHLLDNPSVEISTICDIYNPSIDKALQLIPGQPEVYKNYKEMLRKAKLDGVVIATPLHWHAPMTIEALTNGIHVFCEKSMAKTMRECLNMYEAHKKTGKILQLGHQRLFDIRYIQGIEKIRKGYIGHVTLIRAYWHRNSDWRRPVPSPHLDRLINWRLYHDYSGGLMTELGVHQIHIANWVLQELPEYAIGSGNINYWKDKRETHDNVAVVYRYPSGVHCIYDAVLSNRFYGLEEQVMGNRGTIEFESGKIYPENPPPAPGILQLINDWEKKVFNAIPVGGASWIPETAIKNKGDFLCNQYPVPDCTKLQMETFVESIRTGRPIPELAEHGYNAGIAALMGFQATMQKEPVIWPSEFKL